MRCRFGSRDAVSARWPDRYRGGGEIAAHDRSCVRIRGASRFAVGAYGAGQIRRAILSPSQNAKRTAEKNEMASTALPKTRIARYSHTPAYTDGRPGLAYVDQGNARPAANVDQAAQDTADHQQAEYFVGLLTQSRDLLDQRIDKYESQVAISQASGDVENVRALRRNGYRRKGSTTPLGDDR